ncbi:MAG: hypothetical protein LUH63_04825 [Parabacteroides sp.]|nr:hypothetical protein [Parabacteroides sp.]
MKIKHLLLYISGGLCLSCQNYFELEYPVNPPVSTVEDLERAAAGAYYYMSGLSGNVGVPDNLTVYVACTSDEVRSVEGGG